MHPDRRAALLKLSAEIQAKHSPTPVRNPIRPKQRAAAASTGAAAVVVWIADGLGVDTASVPAPVWVLIAGALATGAAILKRDGLRGAWERLVNGEPS